MTFPGAGGQLAKLTIAVIADASKAIGSLKGVDSQLSSTKSSADRFGKAMNFAMAGATTAAISFAVSSFNSSLKFNKAMTAIQAVTGQTSAKIDVLGKEIMNMGRKTSGPICIKLKNIRLILAESETKRSNSGMIVFFPKSTTKGASHEYDYTGSG